MRRSRLRKGLLHRLRLALCPARCAPSSLSGGGLSRHAGPGRCMAYDRGPRAVGDLRGQGRGLFGVGSCGQVPEVYPTSALQRSGFLFKFGGVSRKHPSSVWEEYCTLPC